MRNLKECAQECMEMLDNVGIRYGRVTDWKVNTRARSRWGQTTMYPGQTFVIDINVDLLDERNDIKGLQSTILHELLHTCKDCWDHGAEWKRLASVVNNKYGMNVKRINTAEEKGVVVTREDIKPVKQYVVRCPCCGAEWKRSRKVDLIKYPEFYRCGKCDKPLERVK